MVDNVNEEKQGVDDLTDKDGKHPETVSWNQYVGIKQSLGKKLDTATQKIGTLEEQAKGNIGAEEHGKVKVELDSLKATNKEEADKAKVALDASLKVKRETIVGKGISGDKVANMSLEQLDGLLEVAATIKPGADMGGGGGGASDLKGKSPIALAALGYEQSKK